MASQLEILAARRKSLVLMAAQQRGELAAECSQLQSHLLIADSILRLVEVLRKRPWLAALGTALYGAISLDNSGLSEKISSLLKKVQWGYDLWKKFSRL